MVNYRLATEDDYENINQFHNRIYQKNRTNEQFRWEFHDCPFGRAVYVIATDGDRVVGTNCVIPMLLTDTQGRQVLTGKSEDTLVDPDYRGMNIFQHIYEFLFRACETAGIQIIWGYTSAKKPFRKIGFEVPFDHQQSLIVQDVWSGYQYLAALNYKNSFLQKLKIMALCVVSKIKSTQGIFKRKALLFTIEEKDENPWLGVDQLVAASAGSAGHFYIHQSEEFQRWRIYTNPNYTAVHTYRVYNRDKALSALIVLNSHPDGTAWVIQSCFDVAIMEDERAKLLNSVVRSMFRKGIKLIRNWHFNTSEIQKQEISVFKKSNFIVLDRGIGFVWKDLASTGLDPKNFLLSRISTEGVI